MIIPAKIFLSYAHDDFDSVNEIYEKLLAEGHRPWMDRHDLLPGQRWEKAVMRALKEADLFLACLSEKSYNKRGFLQREIREALYIAEERLDTDIYIIPARLSPCEVPELLHPFQWANLFHSDGWVKLANAVKVSMEHRQKLLLK